MTEDGASLDGPTKVIHQAGKQPVLVHRRATLRVVAGPDQGASARLELQRVSCGTASDNALVLSDDQVSRHHLELQVQDAGYLVRDLGSTNGTFYRGARVQEALLAAGAELRLGSTVLRLEPGEELSLEVAGRPTFGALVGTSREMQEVYGLLAAVAPTDVTVLIEGETGTGKELVAEELHQQSPRAADPLVVVDCGSLPPNLIESELFGHERGAFTGALSTRIGAFEEAKRGTVFLDEIGELPLELQSRLLRVLDRREIKRVGSNQPRPVNVRVVAATNRDLSAEVRAGRFREDLFFRLAVIRIVLPPLRKRRADIPLLAQHFLLQAGCSDMEGALTEEVLAALGARKWAGNVRELRNFIERVVLLADGAGAALDPPPASVQPAKAGEPAEPAAPPPWSQGWLARALPPGYLERPFKGSKDLLVHQFEALYLARLVERHGDNISRIAREAGVDRVLVRRMLRKHGFRGAGVAGDE